MKAIQKMVTLAQAKNQVIEINNKINTITGGFYKNDTKSKIISDINNIINPSPAYKHLSDIFKTPQLINRTNYFTDVLSKLSNLEKGQKILINDNCYGSECLVVIYAKDGTVQYLSPNGNTESQTLESKENLGEFCLISTVQSGDSHTIRQVIINSDTYVQTTDASKLNTLNAKFAKILGMKCVKYTELTIKNYKKTITEILATTAKNAKSSNKITTLEFTQNLPWYGRNIEQWSPTPLPITFLCRKCPSDYIDSIAKLTTETPPKNSILYILYLTTTASDIYSLGIKRLPFNEQLFGAATGMFFQPIQFAPATRPNAFIFYSNETLDNKYTKLIWRNDSWSFVETVGRIATFTYGDNYKPTELSTWNNCRNPLTLKDLTLSQVEIQKQMYFVNVKTDLHQSAIKLNNFVKRELIKSDMDFVIDLASGRASDLMNYRNANTKRLLFCEIDKDAVDVATERQYKMKNPNKTPLSILTADLNQPAADNIATMQHTYNTPLNSASNINCFFALHYLTDMQGRIDNITKMISQLLKNGGEFLYTAFDFKAVDKLLSANNGKWEITEKNTKKYSIIRHYDTKDIKTAKRSIKLILPFNVNTYYYNENLINDELLDKSFAKHGLKPSGEGSFMDFAPKFKDKKSHFYNNLSDADKTFINLYKYKTYKKI